MSFEGLFGNMFSMTLRFRGHCEYPFLLFHPMFPFLPTVVVLRGSSSSKNRNSSWATPIACMLTSIALVVTSFRMFILSFSGRLTSALEQKPAAVFIASATCALTTLHYSTQWQAFQMGGGIILVWKKRVTELLSAKTITGKTLPHMRCQNSENAEQIAGDSFAFIDRFDLCWIECFWPTSVGFWIGAFG